MRAGIRVAIAAVLVPAAVACTGGGGADDAASAIARLRPCELLDEPTATALAGVAVEATDVDADDDGAACAYAFADPSAAPPGAAIAAALTLRPGSDDDLPGSDLTSALDLGDRGATVTDDHSVQVVYIIDGVVVKVDVTPLSGDVDGALTDVVDFAAATVPALQAAIDDEPIPSIGGPSSGHVIVTCDGTGPACGDVGALSVEADAPVTLDLVFTYAQCGDLAVDVSVDGEARGTALLLLRGSPVTESFGTLDAGEHELGFDARFTGTECNDGTLLSWQTDFELPAGVRVTDP